MPFKKRLQRLFVATRGFEDWRDRLTNDNQWKRKYSAFEAAVSWEIASKTPTGLPAPIAQLFRESNFNNPELLFAIAEHRVPLAGAGHCSQCDVWAFLNTEACQFSLSVEAKSREPFGKGNETVAEWLEAGKSQTARNERQIRWNYILKHLPPSHTNGGYLAVPYQLLHRCATAVIEAKRFRLRHAALVVQAFEPGAKSFEMFSRMCEVMGVAAEHNRMQFTIVGGVNLGIGWADCSLATDRELALASPRNRKLPAGRTN